MTEGSFMTELPEERMHVGTHTQLQGNLHASQAHQKRRHVAAEASATWATTLLLLATGAGSAAAHVLQKKQLGDRRLRSAARKVRYASNAAARECGAHQSSDVLHRAYLHNTLNDTVKRDEHLYDTK